MIESSQIQIIMHPTEVDLISTFLSAANSYFEFGMGGSTILASSLVRDKVFAIESDVKWIETVRGQVKSLTERVVLKHVDVGPTQMWGTPLNRDAEEKFDAYSRAIVDTGYSDFDLCLVDGRFRVACFLQALAHLRSDAVIAIHDYAVRPEYHLVEQFARKISGRHQLYFFVRKPDCNMKHLHATLDAYRRNWT